MGLIPTLPDGSPSYTQKCISEKWSTQPRWRYFTDRNHRRAERVGFVRYSMLDVPDADYPYPEIGFGIPEVSARRKGYGLEAVELLVAYLFSGYPTEQIAAFTDIENIPAQNILENLGFQREGIVRKGLFRDGDWHDIAMYGILRGEFV